METFAVLMAGGSGTRFWPASRRARAKQYLPVAGGQPLLRQTLDRLDGLVPLENRLIVTTREQRDEVARVLDGFPPDNVLAEPCARNTAPCVALAAAEIRRRNPDSVQIVLPADHVIDPTESFQASARVALEQAQARGALLTFGIRPTHAATGYGYIESGEPATEDGTVLHVQRFVEKPNRAKAEEFLAAGNFLWNAGIFVWTTRAITEAIERWLPEVASGLQTDDLESAYAGFPSVPIDVAVLERADSVQTVPIDYTWSDVGSWSALAEVIAADSDGHVASGGGELASLDAADCIVYSEPDHLTALVGVRDLVVVHCRGATLVCPRERAEEVKALVEKLHEGESPFV